MIEAGKRYIFRKLRYGEVEQTFTGTVTGVEDRGDYLYIGYKPDNFRICRFGYFRIKKEGQYKVINWELAEAAEAVEA